MIVKFLVDEAIYKSLQDRQHQPIINNGYADAALISLNLLLDEWRDFIPFHEEITFNDVVNLTATTFVSVASVDFIINKVVYPLKAVNLNQFTEIKLIEDLTGFPIYYYFDLLTQTIQVYPSPSNPTYQFKVWGRVQQINLGINDTVPANMPPFMQSAIIYELGFRLCGDYGVTWDEKKEATRIATTTALREKKDFDLTPDRDIVFSRPSTGGNSPFPWFYYMSGGGQ